MDQSIEREIRLAIDTSADLNVPLYVVIPENQTQACPASDNDRAVVIQVQPNGTHIRGLTLEQAQIRHLYWIAEFIAVQRAQPVINSITVRIGVLTSILDLMGQTRLGYPAYVRSELQHYYLNDQEKKHGLHHLAGIEAANLVGRFERECPKAHDVGRHYWQLPPEKKSPEQIPRIIWAIATDPDEAFARRIALYGLERLSLSLTDLLALEEKIELMNLESAIEM